MRSYDYLVEETNFIKDCYFMKSPEYELQQKKKMDFIEKISHLEKGMKVLDVCCGTGTAAVSLAQRGYETTGLDISREMLRLAKKRAASRKVKVSWVKADVCRIPFRNEFDTVMALEPFGYAEDNRENVIVLKKMSRALKSKGRLLIESYDREFIIRHKRKWLSEGSNWAIRFEYDTGTDKLTAKGIIPAKNGKGIRVNFAMYLYSKAEWKKLLFNAGMESVKIHDSLHSTSMFVSGIKRG